MMWASRKRPVGSRPHSGRSIGHAMKGIWHFLISQGTREAGPMGRSVRAEVMKAEYRAPTRLPPPTAILAHCAGDREMSVVESVSLGFIPAKYHLGPQIRKDA